MSREEASTLPFKVKVLLGHWDQPDVQHGVLFRKWESDDGRNVRYRYVLPKSLIPNVLHDLYSSVIAGHLGMTKTLHKVQERLYLVGMKEDVRSFIRQCPDCARRQKAEPE